MDRRSFVKKSATAVSALGLGMHQVNAINNIAPENSSLNFKLKYAPHLGLFTSHAGKEPSDQINFMADQGFTAFEDNRFGKRSVEVQEQIAKTLVKRNMEMGVFVAAGVNFKDRTENNFNNTITSGTKESFEKFLRDIKSCIEPAKRVNAKWVTIIPGLIYSKLHMDYQTANVVEVLKQASAILEPHGITMVLEPLNHFVNHPGAFLSRSAQAYQICKAVNSPACKILFDIYHLQIQEGNIINNIDKCWDEIAYFQIGDNPGRKEPTTGEINYKNIFKHIHSKGYDGILGMEHGKSMKEKAGEIALLNAYKVSDSF
ncbi:TIM barrel protein [uncultured Algibacter sp.]|uniref:hydroxypyruvate isomerase family protein n=1 Tax=uncultured Algibacter sp. TaxID=298659 RepID=UPI002621B010|nr:TIM barrel protein [uncultured Algibacter sp.]